jgi:hypothetical protein
MRRSASTAGVAPHGDPGFQLFGELLDLRRGGFVEAACAPVVEDAVPVGPVDAAGARDTAAATVGMYSANVGTGARCW